MDSLVRADIVELGFRLEDVKIRHLAEAEADYRRRLAEEQRAR